MGRFFAHSEPRAELLEDYKSDCKKEVSTVLHIEQLATRFSLGAKMQFVISCNSLFLATWVQVNAELLALVLSVPVFEREHLRIELF